MHLENEKSNDGIMMIPSDILTFYAVNTKLHTVTYIIIIIHADRITVATDVQANSTSTQPIMQQRTMNKDHKCIVNILENSTSVEFKRYRAIPQVSSVMKAHVVI